MRRRGRPVAAAVALLVVAAVVTVPSLPASAATGAIGLSADGVSFSSSFGGQLFGGAAIVPGGTATRSFWVKNQETTAGNLAVAIRDVAGTDGVFIQALSVTAEAGISSGPTVDLIDVQPCTQLVGGVPLAAGGVVRVDVSLSLASTLTDREAQASIGEFDIVVALRSADVAAPDACASGPVVGPPPTGGGGTGGGSTPGYSATATVPGAGGTAPADGGEVGPAPPTLPETADGEGLAGGGAHADYWNTARLFQEYFVAWWLLAFVLGGVYAWFRHRRRERIPE